VSDKNLLTILFIADIVGKPGLDIITALLPNLKKQYRVDLCIANGENGYNGRGLTEQIVRKYLNTGIDIITGGNHSWNFSEFRAFLDTSTKVLRPLNFPDEAPGKGSVVFTTHSGQQVGIINLQGRTFMNPIDCPFKKSLEEIERIKQKSNIIFVDFHAEATAEKVALAWYLDGKVSAIVGTHTHVQTADERILPGGTAYITDTGMTGPFDSVIGLDINVAIKRFVTQLPEKYRMATSNIRMNAVAIDIDTSTGRAKNIKRINLP